MSEVINISVGTTLKDAERMVIAATLSATHGSISAAARILGVDRSTLYSKIRRHNVPRVFPQASEESIAVPTIETEQEGFSED